MGKDERVNTFNRARQDAPTMLRTKAYDRFQRPLQEGDVVLLLGKGDIFWRVQKVAPSMHPSAPAGMVELSLVAVFVTGVQGGEAIPDLIKVRDVSEVQQPPQVEES